MKTTIQTSRGPVRFHSVGEPIVGIPATQNTVTQQHTPGPWKHVCRPQNQIVGGTWGSSICEIYPSATEGLSEANARLIASAPELLAALEAIASRKTRTGLATLGMEGTTVSEPAHTLGECMEIASAAIAKAKGVQS